MTDWTEEFIEKELAHRDEQDDFGRASSRFLNSVKSALDARHEHQISVNKTSSYELVVGSESSEHKTFFQLDPSKQILTLIGQWGGEVYPVTVHGRMLKFEKEETLAYLLKKAVENVLPPQKSS